MVGRLITVRKNYTVNNEIKDRTMCRKEIIPFYIKRSVFVQLFAMLTILFSCTDDESRMLNDDSQYVTFTVSTPYSAPGSYAMSDVSDNAVKTVDILAFRVEEGNELYTYRTSGVEIKDGADNTKKEFTVTLRKDEEVEYRFVIVVNATEELDALATTQIATKSQLLGRLLSINPEKWNTTSETDFKPIPMWGETKNTLRITDNVKKITDITLLRSLVSIDVTVGENAKADFKLNEVNLYNRRTRGRIVPISSNFNQTDTKVTGTSMPLDNMEEPLLVWEGLKYTSYSDQELKQVIYTYESPAVEKEKDLDATCLVIGGLYKSKQTFYRLDFVERESNGSFKGYVDLLRNHRYTFSISNVVDHGYNTADDAFYGKKVGLEANVIAWNMSEMPNVEVDEDYFLKVSQGQLDIISKEIYYGMISVQTDYPKAWSVQTKEPWITITKKENSCFYFTLSTLTSGSREGKVILKAGNLTKEIKIKQSAS